MHYISGIFGFLTRFIIFLLNAVVQLLSIGALTQLCNLILINRSRQARFFDFGKLPGKFLRFNFLIIFGFCLSLSVQGQWTVQTSAADNDWRGVAYGNGLWVAVSSTVPGNRVMTSPDGITWTVQTSAADNFWRSVAYGNGLWVAVSSNGTGNRVMTSPDGITWTAQTSAADNFWTSVAYGNGLFVAVAASGTGNRVMTSPDGITWTIRTSAADNSWNSVAFGNSTWVAVSYSGTGNRVMTSTSALLPLQWGKFDAQKKTDKVSICT
jgi:predicted RecA/RadA family phage recombinase